MFLEWVESIGGSTGKVEGGKEDLLGNPRLGRVRKPLTLPSPAEEGRGEEVSVEVLGKVV